MALFGTGAVALTAFSSEADTGSPKKTRQNKRLELRSDFNQNGKGSSGDLGTAAGAGSSERGLRTSGQHAAGTQRHQEKRAGHQAPEA